MNDVASLDHINRKLQQLFGRVLETERQFDPSIRGLSLLDQLINDPRWVWLRSFSALIAEIDHVLAQGDELSNAEHAAAAAHVRGLLFGEGDLANEAFLARYRPLLQLDPELASMHGELRQLLNSLPREPENESERLHARHQWAMRCKHRRPDRP